MQNNIQNLIEIAGITRDYPQEASIFTEFPLQADLVLPSHKPDIERLLKISCHMEALNIRCTSTAKGRSPEGQILTGRRLTVEGRLHYRVEYLISDLSSSVQTVHISVPFYTRIALAEQTISPPDMQAACYVEDLSVLQADGRTLQTSALLLVTAIPSTASQARRSAFHVE